MRSVEIERQAYENAMARLDAAVRSVKNKEWNGALTNMGLVRVHMKSFEPKKVDR